MKVKKTLDDIDYAIAEILDDPVLCGEFIRSEPDDGIDYHFDGFQKEILLDFSPYLSMCSGRAVGKTLTIESIIIQRSVSNKYERAGENEVDFIVPNRAQLDPVYLRLTRMFRNNFFLKAFIDFKSGVNAATHEIRLVNGALIRCRIVGSAADSNVVGLHASCIIADESQLFPYIAWGSMNQALHRHDKEGKELQIGEYQMLVSGVPNGMRERNVLYEVDQQDARYSRHHISRLQSPRYTQDQHERDLKQYGGTGGEDYVHLVLGEHGSPSFFVFDRRHMRIEDYPVRISSINDTGLSEAGGDWSKLLIAPELPLKYEYVALACDCGYVQDPSIFIVLYANADYTGKYVWRELARFDLRKIKYPVQAKIIDWLDTIYNFNLITIDQGAAGIALGQILQDNEEYKKKNFLGSKLLMVDFNSTVVVGYRDGEEIKERVKRFTITTLSEWLQADYTLVLSNSDPDLIDELERVGFTRDMSGRPNYFVYTAQGGQRGEDHMLASLTTWVYGWWMNNYALNKQEKHGSYSDLAKPKWNHSVTNKF